MKILVTGATGLIGKHLVQVLQDKGFEDFVFVSRNPKKLEKLFPFPHEAHAWDPQEQLLPSSCLEGVEAIVHLAGEPVADKRWNTQQKQELYNSRILSTNNIISSLKKHKHSVKTFICASAIGFYGNRGDEKLSESSKQGQGFMPLLCQRWEQEAFKAQNLGIRCASLRIGIVLSSQGGALSKMLLPFSLGLGGPIGFGKAWMSWIHITDLCRQIHWLLTDPKTQGIYNGVAPHPVRNKTFTKALAAALKRPAIFPAPPLALKIALGEMSEIILGSQKILPKHSLEAGFQFDFPYVQQALEDVLQSQAQAEHILETKQWLPHKREQVFAFFSDAKNLEQITPKTLNFKIVDMSNEQIQKGTLINYALKIHGIPVHWRTLIEQWQDDTMFVDRQIKGPYKLWHHTHNFKDFQGGTLVTDRVRYKTYGGRLLSFFLLPWIRKDLKHIFDYRKQKIDENFSQS